MLVSCSAIVADVGATLKQRWVNVLYQLGGGRGGGGSSSPHVMFFKHAFGWKLLQKLFCA